MAESRISFRSFFWKFRPRYKIIIKVTVIFLILPSCRYHYNFFSFLHVCPCRVTMYLFCSWLLESKTPWNHGRISFALVSYDNKIKLDMRPLPRARVKLGGWTRSPRFWWKKPFDPCDPKSKFEPISVEEGSTWCICMSYIDKVCNIEEIMHFLVKIKVWPLWPQMTPGWPMTP